MIIGNLKINYCINYFKILWVYFLVRGEEIKYNILLKYFYIFYFIFYLRYFTAGMISALRLGFSMEIT